MEKPDFDRVYDIFIQIGLPPLSLTKLIEIIRRKIHPLISQLKKNKMINIDISNQEIFNPPLDDCKQGESDKS